MSDIENLRTYVIDCPHCGTRLRLQAEPGIRRDLYCPSCEKAFTVRTPQRGDRVRAAKVIDPTDPVTWPASRRVFEVVDSTDAEGAFYTHSYSEADASLKAIAYGALRVCLVRDDLRGAALYAALLNAEGWAEASVDLKRKE